MAVLVNGWAIAACIGYAFFTAPTLFGALSRRRLYGALRAAAIISPACSAYLVACGAYMAASWTNPFAGQGDRLAGAVHNPRGWFVVGLIVAWPAVLVVVGAAMGYLSLLVARDPRRLG